MPPSATQNSTLRGINAGDYVWIDIKSYWNDSVTPELYQISHVDKNGRLFISAESLWDQWRYGFHPETGKSQKYARYTMRTAASDEIARELVRREKEREAEKAKQEHDHRKWLAQKVALEMLEVLVQADLQIEYMQQKFKETGTGNAIRGQIQAIVRKAKGE